MLQRAASHAHSWWWSSHIRTKQSKWLEKNHQDMEAMITSMLKIIEEDADTFAKRAEMYYRKRPELTKWVQETYRAYRALAERYDHLSGSLQKANNTIATIFPDQHFGMEDEDDDNSNEEAASRTPPPHLSPYESARALREANKTNRKKVRKKRSRCSVGEEAEEEIDRLQKDILVLQTEKEFVKSSYECGIDKFWEKHNMITALQERLSRLQDELGDDVVIEDDEARALMAVTAVKSCVETLANLYEKRIKCMEEAREESRRIAGARDKLGAIRKECRSPTPEKLPDPCPGDQATRFFDDCSIEEEELETLRQHKLVLDSVCEKVRKKVAMDTDASILDIADEIDEHVSKVGALETAASSQVAHVEMLRAEVDELHELLESLEGGSNANPIHETGDLEDRLKMAEEEVHRVEDLNRVVEDEGCNLQRQFTEVHSGLKALSSKIRPKDEENETEDTRWSTSESTGMVVEEESSKKVYYETKDRKCTNSGANQMPNSAAEEGFQDNGERKEAMETSQENHESQDKLGRRGSKEKKSEELLFGLETNASHDHHSENGDDDDDEDGVDDDDDEEEEEEEEDDDDVSLMNWQEMFLAELKDREKVIMAEYTSIVQSYKELKKKLKESDRKYQDNMFQNTDKMRGLKNSIIMKDEEIRSLRQQLQFLATSLAESTGVDVAEPEMQDIVMGASGKISRSTSITSLNSDPPVSTPSSQPETTTTTTKGDQMWKIVRMLSSRRIASMNSEPPVATPIEGKFRKEIDQLLDDNLELWLRFRSSFEQMRKWEEEFQGLEDEITVLVDGREEGAVVPDDELHQKDGAAARASHTKLKGLQAKMSTWMQENAHMNEELHCRFSSLSNIEEEILRVAKEGGEGGINFTAYHALKFQGEIVNMRQDNNHVAGELHSSMDRIASLQAKVPTLLQKLDSRFELSTSKPNKLGDPYSRTSSSKIKVPLSVFLFGTRRKKRRHSILCCINPSFQRQFSDLAS